METRREFLGKAIAGLSTLIVSCAHSNQDVYFNEFKDSLGSQWDDLSYSRKKRTEKVFSNYDKKEKESVIKSYAQKPSYDLKYDSEIEKFISENDAGINNDVKTSFPWIDSENITSGDKALIMNILKETPHY